MSDLNNMLDKSALRKFLLDRRISNSNNNELSNNLHIHIEPLISSFDDKNHRSSLGLLKPGLLLVPSALIVRQNFL